MRPEPSRADDETILRGLELIDAGVSFDVIASQLRVRVRDVELWGRTFAHVISWKRPTHN